MMGDFSRGGLKHVVLALVRVLIDVWFPSFYYMALRSLENIQGVAAGPGGVTLWGVICWACRLDSRLPPARGGAATTEIIRYIQQHSLGCWFGPSSSLSRITGRHERRTARHRKGNLSSTSRYIFLSCSSVSDCFSTK